MNEKYLFKNLIRNSNLIPELENQVLSNKDLTVMITDLLPLNPIKTWNYYCSINNSIEIIRLFKNIDSTSVSNLWYLFKDRSSISFRYFLELLYVLIVNDILCLDTGIYKWKDNTVETMFTDHCNYCPNKPIYQIYKDLLISLKKNN